MAEGMVNSSFKKSLKGAIFLLASSISLNGLFAQAISLENTTDINEKDEQFFIGGGYAVTKQISGAGYSCEIYNAEHGLPTSDANYVFGSSDGHVWIGGYAGIFRYDGMVFEKLPPASGFTSGRGFFEDSKNRIWVATNDNGVVVVDGDQVQHFTYRDGLPSSSIRVFAEDKNENIFIGTTSGLAYVDKSGKVNLLSDKRLDKERILRLDSDFNGRVYGQTKNGAVFLIEDCRIKSFYTGRELGMGKITTLLADHENAGKVYLGTENNYVYYGVFGSTASRCTKIDVSPLKIFTGSAGTVPAYG